MPEFIVTPKSLRPASTNPYECFHCHALIGKPHKPDCVLIQRKVLIRMTVTYEVSVPNHWDAEMLKFHRDESTWCADNALPELESWAKSQGCLCASASFEHVADVADSTYLEEN